MPDFGPFIRDAYREILGREADPGGLAHYNRLMNQGLGGATLREALIRSPEYADKNPIRPLVAVRGRRLLVDEEPLRQFTLFAAGLRDEGTLADLFRSARAKGFNCARIGSETADWGRPSGAVRDLFDGLNGPEPGSAEQIENLARVVRVAARERMALEVCASFTIKERPFQEQLAHVRRTAAELKDETHVMLTAVNEPYVNALFTVNQTNRLLRALLSEAPERLRGVDEDGFQSPEFRYDDSICDFIAYHWPRDQGWEQAPGVDQAVARWNKPVFLNETQCFQSEEEVEEFGPHPLCQTNREGFQQMMEAIYRQGGFGCFHSIWGLRSEHFGFAPQVDGLGLSSRPGAEARAGR
jgi:hypothetical protein